MLRDPMEFADEEAEDAVGAPRWDELTKRMGGPVPVIDAGDDDGEIPPREWLQGTSFCRRFISALTGGGSAGKTAVRYLQYLAQATGRPLACEKIHHRCPVLITCLEDGIDEVRRRIRALTLRYNIPTAELKGWLFCWAPNGHRLLEIGRDGRPVPGELEPEFRELIAKHNIGLAGIDPFIKAHGCDENDNNAVDAVCILLAKIAEDCNCAIDLLHHHRKGALSPGDADSGRGASALKDAARLVRTITPMTSDEAKTFGLSEDERAHLVRVDDAKVNLTPRAAKARWFKLVGIPLENGTSAYPNGDTVQAAEPWDPPDTWQGLTDQVLNEILTEIDGGLPDGNKYSDAGAARDRAAWKIVCKHAPDKTETQAREIIKTWVKNGVLVVEEYTDPVRHEPARGLKLDPTRRPGPHPQ